MTDDFEDRLRNHLSARAAQIQIEPDPSAFVEHGAARSRRRGVLAAGMAALVVVAAGAGVLVGVDLIGSSTSAQTATPEPPGKSGAALAPIGSGGPLTPAIVGQAPYALLFTRVTASGVTIRAYTAGPSSSGGCGPAVVCSPTTSVPPGQTCPSGAVCAQPVVPHVSMGASGSTTAPVEGVAPPGAGSVSSEPAVATGTSPTGAASSGPLEDTSACTPLVLELSTDEAVGTGSVSLPGTAPASSVTLDVLGTGSFGTAERAPVGWVAVSVGNGVSSVQLSVGGTVVDTMAPSSGIVVLAATGDAGLDGASVTGLDPSGANVGSVPAGQVAAPGAPSACPAPASTPVTPTTTTTTTTTPPTSTTTVTARPVAVAVTAR
jgi:hypothetical protein